ncbi:hypothetical protein C0J52_22594 [Blattella germanica]|nr:hypothetical protein C0J52_22594 [Blattella germanica]
MVKIIRRESETNRTKSSPFGIYPFNKDIFGEVDFLPATNTRTMLENDTRVDNASKDQPPPTNTSLPVSITPVKENLPVNVAVASTSSSQTFQRAIQQISPVADDLQRKIVLCVVEVPTTRMEPQLKRHKAKGHSVVRHNIQQSYWLIFHDTLNPANSPRSYKYWCICGV